MKTENGLGLSEEHLKEIKRLVRNCVLKIMLFNKPCSVMRLSVVVGPEYIVDKQPSQYGVFELDEDYYVSLSAGELRNFNKSKGDLIVFPFDIDVYDEGGELVSLESDDWVSLMD